LKCENCGGVLQKEDSEVFTSGDTVIIKAGYGFECEHCGSRFDPGTEHAVSSGNNITLVGSGAIATHGGVAASAGGVAIAGNVGGDIVVGAKRVSFDQRGTVVGTVVEVGGDYTE
jgi:YgiT-type zinc finger domain-containing protein